MSSKPKEEPAEQGPKKTSMVVHIASFLIVTALAAGSGFGASIFLKGESTDAKTEMAMKKSEEGDAKVDGHGEDAKEDAHKDTKTEDGEKKKDNGEEEEENPLTGYAKPLAPILTNLAAPKDVWVRLELAIVTSQQATDELLEQIHQDLFAYIRTVKLHHVEGPSGYINLKAELNERAAIRSGGTVTKVLVRTMLFE